MEWKRQFLHMSMLVFALALKYLTVKEALAAAGFAFLFNFFVLPRTGLKRRVFRQQEKKFDLGIVSYPMAVFFLILLFPMHIAAAVWAITALGDGFSNLVGRKFGNSKLPWNGQKSWTGMLAFLVFGFAGAVFFMWWVNPMLSYSYIFALSLLGAGFGALVETVPVKIDDNITVPLFTGAFVFALSLVSFSVYIPAIQIGYGLLLSGFVAVAAYFARAVRASGALGGIAVGTAIFAFLGLEGFLILLSFFVMGSIGSRLKYRKKVKLEIAQGHGGARGARHAFANSVVAMFVAFLAFATPYKEFLVLAFLGAFAAAAADTMSNEIGVILGRKPVLITTLEPAKIGENGAVTRIGTLAGFAAAIIIAGIGYRLGMVGWHGMLIVALAGFVGTTIDSILGATLERQGCMGNESVNFACTLSGALFCFIALL